MGLGKPVNFQAFAQPEAGTVQLNIQVGRRQPHFLTNFLTREFQPFAHQKHTALRGGQFVGAGLQDFKKLATADVLFGIAPLGKALREVPVRLEPQVVQWIGFIVLGIAQATNLAAVVAQRVNHLVLQNTDQPGFELRAVGK